MNSINKFLEDRENRVIFQEKLLKENDNCTLVMVKINYPGIQKSNYVNDNIVNIISDEIRLVYKSYIKKEYSQKTLEGCIHYFVIDLDKVSVKSNTIKIEENHILGRCVDIDVYYLLDDEIKGISRNDFNIGPRKCFICENDAKICSRSQSHTIEGIKNYFEVKFEQYINYKNNKEKVSHELSQIALHSMISEVATYPSFGLVSFENSGSHKDMDHYTFLDSSFSIIPFLKNMAEVGYSNKSPKEIFDIIREIGKEAEIEMFKATKNINTHKGMIFILGILMSSTANAIYNKLKFYDIKNIIKEMVEDILDDFKDIESKSNLTNGEKLYKEYKFTGIRGQVHNGLSILFDDILPSYYNIDSLDNDVYVKILLHLMSIVDDSTIVHRHNIDVLKKVKYDASNLLNESDFSKENLKLMNLECEYIKNNISPGGSADLLAACIFLLQINKLMEISC